jgi:hypothetical protein
MFSVAPEDALSGPSSYAGTMAQSEPQITITTWIKMEDGTLVPFDPALLSPPLDPNDSVGWARVDERMRQERQAH